MFLRLFGANRQQCLICLIIPSVGARKDGVEVLNSIRVIVLSEKEITESFIRNLLP